ncbi:MAG: DoxX family protein [Rhodospirillaceae bacterium]
MAVLLHSDTPRWVSAILEPGVTALAARVILTLPYWWSGISKLTHWSAATAEAAGMGFAMPAAVAAATIAVQLVGSLLIIANRYVWLGAGALGVLTVLATVIAHGFWRADAAERIAQQNIFLEHMALVAAFVLVAILSVRARDTRTGRHPSDAAKVAEH